MIVGVAFVVALTGALVWTCWGLASAVRHRQFRLYGVALTPAEHPVGFWIAVLVSLTGAVFIAVFIAKTFWIPIILHQLPK